MDGDTINYQFSFNQIINLTPAPHKITTSIYPNPTNHFININTSKEIIKVEIIDVSGSTQISYKERLSNLDLSKLNNGIYIIKNYYFDNTSESFKFIKK